MKRQTVATPLVVGLIVFSMIAPMFAAVPASAAPQPGNSTATEDFSDGLNPWSSSNVTSSNGTVQLTTQGGTTVDDFEDGDLSEYSGATSMASIETRSGSQVLNLTNDATNTLIGDNSSNLPAYPEPGDTFSYAINYSSSSAVSRVFWAAGGISSSMPNDGYSVRIHEDIDEMNIEVRESGATNNLATRSLSKDYSGTGLRVKVHWGTNGDINTTLMYDSNGTVITRLNASNSSFTKGGVAFHSNDASSGSKVFYDNLSIQGEVATTGSLVYRYNTSQKARLASLDWDTTETDGDVTKYLKFGKDGTYTEVTNQAEWRDLDDDRDVFVKFDMTPAAGSSPSLDQYTVEYRTWNSGIYLGKKTRIARESSNAALTYYESPGNAQNISDNFSIDTTQDANLTVSSLDLDGEEVTQFTVDMDSGSMNVTLRNVSNDTYDVYQDGEVYRNNVTVSNGTLTVEKSSGWSEHSFRVVEAGAQGSDDSEMIVGRGCSDGNFHVPLLGCLDIVVLIISGISAVGFGGLVVLGVKKRRE